MNDRIHNANRYKDRPQLKSVLESLSAPDHVSDADRRAVLFEADRFGEVSLVSDWWSDDPTPDRLFDVPEMPRENYEEAIRSYVSLLFSLTHPVHPLSEEEVKETHRKMWGAIQYLKRRKRAAELLSRLDAFDEKTPADSPDHFSEEEYRIYRTELLPLRTEELSFRIRRALQAPMSACPDEKDRARLASLSEEEALLQHMTAGMETPWEHFPDVDAADPGWKNGIKADFSEQFRLFYANLTAGQRLRFRKRHKEPKAFSGYFARLDCDLNEIPEISSASLASKGILLGWHKRSAPTCKQLADKYRLLTGDSFSNLVVFGSGTVVRVFSDVEAPGVKEAKKILSAFKRGKGEVVTEKIGGHYVLRCDPIMQIEEESVYRDALGGLHEDLIKKTASIHLLDRLMQDVYAPLPILYLGSRGFSNVDQKAELIKEQKKQEKNEKKKQATEEYPVPELPVRDDYVSVLKEGGTVFHRIWGKGDLIEKEDHPDDAFWKVDFSGTEKTLSEKWLIANCRT